MADDTETVGDDGSLVSVAKVTVDILLFDGRVRVGGVRHERVCQSMGLDSGVLARELLGIGDFRADEFGVVLLDCGFDAGSVLHQIPGFLRVERSAYGLRDIDELFKY